MNTQELKDKIETFKKEHSFVVEKKIVGKKEFETYLVKSSTSIGNYIRVTHPLGYWVPPAFKAWLQNNTQKSADKKMTEAGNAGTQIHELIENCKGDLDLLPTFHENEFVQNGIKAFREFWEGCGLNIIAQELQVFSPNYGFAGTIDMIAEKDGNIYVIDWKSGWYKPTYGWQLAAYGLAFKEHFGVEPKLMAVMLDKRSGKASKIEYEHNSHLEACYLGVLQAFAGENWKALSDFWPWALKEFHHINRDTEHQKHLDAHVEMEEKETQLEF